MFSGTHNKDHEGGGGSSLKEEHLLYEGSMAFLIAETGNLM